MKFLIDSTLGKLAKWLRIIGYDTVYYQHPIAELDFQKAAEEGRIFLTRQIKPPVRKYAGQVLIVTHDRLPEQLYELGDKLALTCEPEIFFTRCLRCNANLVTVPREEVAGEVPAFIIENYSDFRKCPSCGKIFWPGTHRDRMLKFIQTRNHAYPL